MKKLSYLIVIVLISSLVLTGCLLSNVGQVPATNQSGIAYLTKNGPPIPSTSLVGLWHFDDDANDSSGNGNTGTLVNGPQLVAGKFGNALSLDGIDDYVDCGSNGTLDFTTDVTIEAWVYPKSTASLQMIVDNRNVTTSGVQLFYRASNNRIEIQINNTTAAKGVVPNSNNWLDSWHHVLATYTSGVGGSVYIDGINVSLDEKDLGNISGTGRTTVIGARYTKTSLFFDGIIDEVRIWNIALSGDAILQSYDLGTEQTYPTVVELGQEFFGDDGDEVVIFTSSFYDLGGTCSNGEEPVCGDCDTITIYMMSNYGDVINGVSERKKPYTPNGTSGCWYLEKDTEGGTSISVDVGMVDCKSIHLSLDLFSERSVGFNAQFLPYDYD